MPGKSNDRVQYGVACRCGMKVSLDAREFGRPRVCKKCGSIVTVMWGKDPATRRNVPVAVTQAKLRAGVRADQAPSIAYCSCGYKIPVGSKSQAAPPNCPGCGKLMVVESKKGTPTIFGAALPKKDRPPSSTSVPVLPPMLRGTTKVPPPLPKPAAGPPPKRPLRIGEIACRCGEVIPARTSRTGKSFTCPACKRQGKVEDGKDEKGNLVMKAVFTSEPAVAPPPPAPPPARSAPPTPAKAEPPVALFEEFDANVEVEFAPMDHADGQQVLCDCGSQIIVTPADAGQHAQCPQCGIVMLVEQVQETSGGPPFMRVRTVGRPDQETWTLEDFK